MTPKWRLGTSAALTLSAVLTSSVFAQDDAQSIETTTLWKRFSATEFKEVSRITPSRDGRFFAAGSTYSKAEGESHWWGELDTSGQRTVIGKDWDVRGFRDTNVVALVLTKGPSIWVVSERTVSKSEPGGKLLFSKSIFKIAPADRYSMGVSAAVATDDGGVLLAGFTQSTRDDMDAWLLRIDADGRRMWEKSCDLGKHDWIVDGTAKGDHFVFVAVSGRSDKFGAGFDRVVVMECDGDGKKIHQHRIQGTVSPNNDSIVATKDGSVLVAYSKGSFPMRDARLVSLGASLEPNWERRLAAPQVTAFTPSVSTVGRDTIVATWNGPRGCRQWQLDRRGRIVKESSHPGTRGIYVRDRTGNGRLFLGSVESR